MTLIWTFGWDELASSMPTSHAELRAAGGERNIEHRLVDDQRVLT